MLNLDGDVIELLPATYDPAEWAATVQMSVGGLTALAAVTGHTPSVQAVCELLRGVPASADGLAALGRLSDGSLLARSLTALRGNGSGRQSEVIAAGLQRLVYQPADRRALLDASIRGALLGFDPAR